MLNLEPDLFHLFGGVGTPGGDFGRISHSLLQDFFFGDLETIATERGIFQGWINVFRRIMFAVAAQPKQMGDDHLRAVARARLGHRIAQSLKAIIQISAVHRLGDQPVTGGAINQRFARKLP